MWSHIHGQQNLLKRAVIQRQLLRQVMVEQQLRREVGQVESLFLLPVDTVMLHSSSKQFQCRVAVQVERNDTLHSDSAIRKVEYPMVEITMNPGCYLHHSRQWFIQITWLVCRQLCLCRRDHWLRRRFLVSLRGVIQQNRNIVFCGVVVRFECSIDHHTNGCQYYWIASVMLFFVIVVNEQLLVGVTRNDFTREYAPNDLP